MWSLSFLLVFLLVFSLFAQTRGNAKKGEDLYMEKCVLCHGSQGEGWDWAKKVEKPPILKEMFTAMHQAQGSL
jgi:cytochrome c